VRERVKAVKKFSKCKSVDHLADILKASLSLSLSDYAVVICGVCTLPSDWTVDCVVNS